MIWKRCGRCGKRIPSGSTCECILKLRRSSGRKSKKGEIRKERSSSRWQKTRAAVLSEYSGIDLYAFYHDGEIVQADQVHHIEEASVDPELFYDRSNLFPCSAGTHDEIHYRYKAEEKSIVQDELRDYLKRWKKEC